MKDLIQKLKIPENSGKKIGLFRTICAIFGAVYLLFCDGNFYYDYAI
ncbi:hypothetical protein ACN2CX_11105 [Aliarcobacter butzleri]